MARSDYSKADRDRYARYIASPEWKRRKRRALDLSGRRCQYEREDPFQGYIRCPRTRYLTVHHRTYARLGTEADADLEVLCYFHHMVEHMMWWECPQCRNPILGDYPDAEAWVADVFKAQRQDPDNGPTRWATLPTKFTLEAMLPLLCLTCDPLRSCER